MHGSAGASDPLCGACASSAQYKFYLSDAQAGAKRFAGPRAHPVRRGKKLRRGAVRRRPVRLCSRHPVRDQNPFRHMLHGAGALERGRLRAHRSLSARAGGRRAAGGDPGVPGRAAGPERTVRRLLQRPSHAEPRQGARRTGRTGGGRVRREPCVQRFQQPGYLPGGPVPLSRI